MIDQQEFMDFLNELKVSLQQKIDDADARSGDYGASESYRADMKGFSRGLCHAMNEILGALRERFPG